MKDLRDVGHEERLKIERIGVGIGGRDVEDLGLDLRLGKKHILIAVCHEMDIFESLYEVKGPVALFKHGETIFRIQRLRTVLDDLHEQRGRGGHVFGA